MKPETKIQEILAMFSEIEHRAGDICKLLNSGTPKRKFLYGSEVMNLLCISESTLRRMRNRKEIPFKKLSRTYIYPADFFDTFMEKYFKNSFKHLYPDEV